MIENVNEEDEEKMDHEEEEIEEITEYVYEGETLVIWRSLNVIQGNDES